jgi:hypothetical protein
VELGYLESFELGEGSADKLIQIRSDQVMWQKERLLNLAVAALPPECRYVAWLDCDVIFQREDWVNLARKALEKSTLVQLFSRSSALNPVIDWSRPLVDQNYVTREAMAARYITGVVDVDAPGDYASTLRSQGVYANASNGYAWAMRKEDVAEAGIYDGYILGTGIAALFFAAIGRSEGLMERHQLSPVRFQHYREWAERFYRMVQGNLGVIPGDIYSLWHGELEDRSYGGRLEILNHFSFDPYVDIAIAENGSWRWNSDKPELHAAVRAYFQNRHEDGREAGSGSQNPEQ